MKHHPQHKTAFRGYGSKWKRVSAAWRKKEGGYCAYCEKRGFLIPAEVVDHIIPHRLTEAKLSGNKEAIRKAEKLFWDRKNWQRLCKDCHDSVKQKEEKSGVLIGAGADGCPIDPNHHWNN